LYHFPVARQAKGRLGGILLINVVIIMRLLPVEDLFSLSANIADREKEARVYR